MKKLLLHETNIANWQSLLADAQAKLNISLEEDLESYLVFLLMRFTAAKDISHNIMALEFLQSLQEHGSLKNNSLRDVGDKCLLFAGLFPGRAQRRRVKVSYFVNLGQSAYSAIDASESITTMYNKLSEYFVALMDVLQATRPDNPAQLELMAALDLWYDTKSVQAFKTIQQSTNSFTLPVNSAKAELH